MYTRQIGQTNLDILKHNCERMSVKELIQTELKYEDFLKTYPNQEFWLERLKIVNEEKVKRGIQ